MEENDYIKKFATQLCSLRTEKNVTARDMSISLGQSHNFINNIELGKNFPTMLNFFYICEYLGISPQEFFGYKNRNITGMSNIVENLGKLTPTAFEHISFLVEALAKTNE